ncbi:MAG TPA: DUF6636 domain-containing protein [Acidimicrobiales bacterium]|nr:DUF6636 domain-containing protein [Acidimicrobiales bacterium]
MTRTRVLLLLLAALVVGGCSGDDDDPTVATSTSVTSTSTSSGGGGATTSTAAPARAQGDTGSGDFSFKSPSDNIFCTIDSEGARCDIREKSWQPPAKPADCDLDWGNSMAVTAGGAVFVCAGDSVEDDKAPPLPYGGVVARGDVRCRSDESGMTCEHTPTGSRFMLSRERYERD